jgi:hypothetical protein
MVIEAGIKETPSCFVFRISRPCISFGLVAAATRPVQVAVRVYEVSEVFARSLWWAKRPKMVDFTAAFLQEESLVDKAVRATVMEVRAEIPIPVQNVVVEERYVLGSLEYHVDSMAAGQAVEHGDELVEFTIFLIKAAVQCLNGRVPFLDLIQLPVDIGQPRFLSGGKSGLELHIDKVVVLRQEFIFTGPWRWRSVLRDYGDSHRSAGQFGRVRENLFPSSLQLHEVRRHI